jgi:hypothetical protein
MMAVEMHLLDIFVAKTQSLACVLATEVVCGCEPKAMMTLYLVRERRRRSRQDLQAWIFTHIQDTQMSIGPLV